MLYHQSKMKDLNERESDSLSWGNVFRQFREPDHLIVRIVMSSRRGVPLLRKRGNAWQTSAES